MRAHRIKIDLFQLYLLFNKSHFTDKSLHMLFYDITPEKIFNVLKEINTFGKH